MNVHDEAQKVMRAMSRDVKVHNLIVLLLDGKILNR